MLKGEKVVPLHDVPNDVRAFLTSATEIYGRHKAEELDQWMWQECRKLSSPIEQLFLAALAVTSEVNIVRFNTGPVEQPPEERNLVVKPQWEIGRYRVDFAVAYRDRPIVCVELDGHAFHDRDEKQRRYEKQRDRFLATRGYVVMHFTGSEVVKDPYSPALEAFNAATGHDKYSINPGE